MKKNKNCCLSQSEKKISRCQNQIIIVFFRGGQYKDVYLKIYLIY